MILDSFRLDGRVAVVTGSSRGIGQSAAIALAEAGADLALIDRSDSTETADIIEAMGRRVVRYRCDLAEAEADSLAGVIDSVVDDCGRIDILINNAGVIRRTAATEYSTADWDLVMRVNIDAAFHLSQAAGRHMIRQGRGRIINLASMLSFQGGILVPAYAASKHAIAGLTKALANEWAADGVTVNAIAPGYIATDNTTAIRADPQREASISQRIPAGRWGTPSDLQGAFLFLASDAAAYINGVVLPVDGGWLVR